MAAKKKGKDDEKKGGGGKKKLIIGVVVLGLAYQFGPLKPKPEAAAPLPCEPGQLKEEDGTCIEEGETVVTPEMVLNLAPTKGSDQLHYAKVQLGLVLEEGFVAEEFETELPIAQDVIVEVISARTFDEVREPEAKAELKKELSTKVREAYEDDKVVRVIFANFVVD